MRERFALHKRAVVEQSEVLKQQGFKVLIVDKLRPDIIARKGDKTYAIEVEFDKPDYEKYQGIQVFDDVIWILRSSKGDHPPFSISPG
jgi:Holliday junction resolvase